MKWMQKMEFDVTIYESGSDGDLKMKMMQNMIM